MRPVRELKGFEKVELQPGESRDVSFTLDKRAFAYWNAQLGDWHVETGEFTIEVGQSSRSIDVGGTVNVVSTVKLKKHYTMDSIFMDIMADPEAMEKVSPLLEGIRKTFTPGGDESDAASEAITEDMSMAMLNYMPLRGVLSFGGGAVSPEMMDNMLAAMNGE